MKWDNLYSDHVSFRNLKREELIINYHRLNNLDRLHWNQNLCQAENFHVLIPTSRRLVIMELNTLNQIIPNQQKLRKEDGTVPATKQQQKRIKVIIVAVAWEACSWQYMTHSFLILFTKKFWFERKFLSPYLEIKY